MADVRWQDICDKLQTSLKSKKLVRESVLIFYASFESNVVTGCDFIIPRIGKFKGSIQQVKREALQKKLNSRQSAHFEKLKKRKQRLWVRKKFDQDWVD